MALDLADEFTALIRKHSIGTLADWLSRAEVSACPEIRHFAEGIRRDESAVNAAVDDAFEQRPGGRSRESAEAVQMADVGSSGIRALVGPRRECEIIERFESPSQDGGVVIKSAENLKRDPPRGNLIAATIRLEDVVNRTHTLRLSAGEADVESLLPDRWGVSHPEDVLKHHLDESRRKASRQKETRQSRRAGRGPEA